MNAPHRFGFVAIAGAPNAGKSTLLNQLLGAKVSIVSSRAQTTRERILGVKTLPHAQIVLVDAPGLHQTAGDRDARRLNKTALESLRDVDLILFMLDQRGWLRQAEQAFAQVTAATRAPMMLLINKIDKLRDKSALLPLIEESRNKHAFEEIVPICARKLREKEKFLQLVIARLPPGAPAFPPTQIRNYDDAFLAGELVREQLFGQLAHELPHTARVEVAAFDAGDDLYRIDGVIWVDKASQKPIVIGKNGERIKSIGERARAQMEKSFAARVFLRLHVKQRAPNQTRA